jgi:hypothetical protein
MNKRGQFYIITAIIIIVILSGLTTLTTFVVTKPKLSSIETISSNLKKEAPRIINYGIYNERNLASLLNNFTDNEFGPYFLKKTKNSNIVFIYGNKTSLFATQYNTTSTGSIKASISGESRWTMIQPYSSRLQVFINPSEKNLNVTILNKTYKFELLEGQMFYFVILQENEGELYIEKNS